MATRVAINGFGRIGRMAFRQLFGTQGYEIVALNDLTSTKMLKHLLQYDTSQGRYHRTLAYTDKTIIVDENEIPVFTEKDPKNLPWKALGVDIVLECTGLFTSRAKAEAHIKAGARKVVISAPAGDDMKTIVFGVNEGTLTPEDSIISAASCTTNCLAPMANALNKLRPIQKGFMTTIHAYTNDQMLLDGPHAKGDMRRARSAAANIIPTSTGAAQAIGQVLPELAGKLDGTSQRVPVVSGSLTELVALVAGIVTKEQINQHMKASVSEAYGYTEDEIVSSDVIGMTYGSLFDATQTKVTAVGGDSFVKVSAWYDNENSYVSQMVRTIKHIATL